LTWTPGAGALSHNVYFGTENPPPFQGNQASASFDPGSLKGGTNYFWRIDEVNAAGTTEGDVWSFQTDSSTLPEPATAPNPTHLENGIDKGVSLSFIPGAGAVSHDIYFGTENPPPFQRIQASSSFDPGPLQPATTYFWQVNEVNADGTTPGFVWRFTTTDSTGAGKSEWWKY
jgi:hypothetical protein